MAAHGSPQSFKILHRPPLQLHSFIFWLGIKARLHANDAGELVGGECDQ
jgi:hypothetical protein